MVWHPGQKLQGGRYIIEKQLGKGGFGIAYLAWNKKGRSVVIKTLKEEVLSDPERGAFLTKYRQDFRDEALRLSLCRHPHIVQMENSFHEGRLPCIVMEYIQGEDLWQCVKRQGVLSEAEALHYIRQIGSALSVIHDKGLLHRDVKPKNIMVRSDRAEAVLIDFGIAREFIPDVTLTHTQAMSNGFAPIEQYAERTRRGEYSDVYALAATLYYLLTATVPTAAFLRAAGIALDPPQQLNPNISDRVNQAILGGMAFTPEDRPKSVPDWLALFESDSFDNLVQTQNLASAHLQEQPEATTLPIDPPVEMLTTSLPALPPPNDLSSEVGIDYSKLRDLLAAGKWQQADRETAALMLKVADRQQEGKLRVEDIENFPCNDLGTIDQLWIKYSNGRFGFSVQKRIWQSIGGNAKANYQNFCLFGDCVGWRVRGNLRGDWLFWADLQFTLNAPVGHLPALYSGWVAGWVFAGVGDGWYQVISSIAWRLETCTPQFLPLDDLTSAVGIDYSKLRDLLANGKWQEADRETGAIILKVCGREKEGWLRVEDIDNFVCEDFRTIDQLWVKYSNGCFGFSVQKRIYESLGGTRNYDENIWINFGDRVGWCVQNQWLYYHDLSFSINAPQGHLPVLIGEGFQVVWRLGVSLLASRLAECNIQ
ncbi:serine/threonine-protein kinase [Coleofasciculus sp. FACHB-1120]|uniref:serine/threonine-protein kinase n=1 Tax=Coleofasciculus sp. FACHB-1120 TaxID=2692783 RepID=UPI001F5573A0|nr:serine/threonine-protein kinase [Coleofasciculus sp. FACHB-1120]